MQAIAIRFSLLPQETMRFSSPRLQSEGLPDGQEAMESQG